MYQIVWGRELGYIFGTSMYAISTVLTSFMAGLALGSYFFGRIIDGYKDKVKFFSYLETQWFPLYDFDESETKVFLNTIKEVFPQATLWMSGSDRIVIASREPVALDYAYIIKMLNQSKSFKKT